MAKDKAIENIIESTTKATTTRKPRKPRRPYLKITSDFLQSHDFSEMGEKSSDFLYLYMNVLLDTYEFDFICEIKDDYKDHPFVKKAFKLYEKRGFAKKLAPHRFEMLEGPDLVSGIAASTIRSRKMREQFNENYKKALATPLDLIVFNPPFEHSEECIEQITCYLRDIINKERKLKKEFAGPLRFASMGQIIQIFKATRFDDFDQYSWKWKPIFNNCLSQASPLILVATILALISDKKRKISNKVNYFMHCFHSALTNPERYIEDYEIVKDNEKKLIEYYHNLARTKWVS